MLNWFHLKRQLTFNWSTECFSVLCVCLSDRVIVFCHVCALVYWYVCVWGCVHAVIGKHHIVYLQKYKKKQSNPFCLKCRERSFYVWIFHSAQVLLKLQWGTLKSSYKIHKYSTWPCSVAWYKWFYNFRGT